MENEILEQLIVHEHLSFGEAIGRFDRNEKGVLAVVDGEKVLKGIITEGDLRKAILKGIPRTKPITAVMNPRPFVMQQRLRDEEMLHLMNTTYHYIIKHVPIVDGEGILLDIVFRDLLVEKTTVRNRALIMAGGEGRRLRPLTNNTPKPLLVVGNKPVLATIIDHLKQSGIDKIYISVAYLAEKIKEYCGDGSRFGVSIEYIHEESKLGTAGCLALVKDKVDAPLIVVNGDVMTQVSFEALLEYHQKEQNSITMAVRKYDIEIPFGVARLNGKHLVHGVEEKPTQSFFINSGVYVFDPEVFGLINSVRRIDMPDLINAAIAEQYRVGGFPIREYWVDIGNSHNFRNAQADYNKYFIK